MALAPRPASPPGPSDTRRAILSAAQERFSRFGARKTTMEEVAREAGCSRATLYLHFPGKSALYGGLLEHETASFMVDLERTLSSSPGSVRKLSEIVAATTRIFSGNPVLCGALLGDDEMTLDQIARPAAAAYERRVTEILAEVLREGIREGVLREVDVDTVAYLMFQLGRVLVTNAVAADDYPLERTLEAMEDLLALGLKRFAVYFYITRGNRKQSHNRFY